MGIEIRFVLGIILCVFIDVCGVNVMVFFKLGVFGFFVWVFSWVRGVFLKERVRVESWDMCFVIKVLVGLVGCLRYG